LASIPCVAHGVLSVGETVPVIIAAPVAVLMWMRPAPPPPAPEKPPSGVVGSRRRPRHRPHLRHGARRSQGHSPAAAVGTGSTISLTYHDTGYGDNSKTDALAVSVFLAP
jgi:hypothetical protein